MASSRHRPRIPSDDEVLSWFDRYSNWDRFGPDDTLGTLHHLTEDRRVAAAGLVRTGEVVSCAWDVSTAPTPDQRHRPPQRIMLATGESPPSSEERWGGAAEFIGVAYHGYAVTHLDALSHYFWDGRMYGGAPAASVTTGAGAGAHAITDVPGGIVGRGVLLDVASLRGVEWLEPGDAVFPEELDAAAARQGVTVEAGDIVLLRTGYGAKRHRHGPDDVGSVGRAGWHVACIPWLHEHDVAAIGADTAQDVHPSGYADIRSPVHAVGIVAMGLWLIDNCDLEALAATCQRLERWEFLLTVAPLRMEGGTGSPVNPLAMF